MIEGLVPPDIHLGDDATARAIVAQGFARLREACPSKKGQSHYLSVSLYQGKEIRPGQYAVEAASISYAGREAEVLGPGEERYRNKIADERKRREQTKKQEVLAEERKHQAKAEAAKREQALAEEKKNQQARSEELKEKMGLDCKFNVICDYNCNTPGVKEYKRITVTCDVAPNIDLSRDEIARDIFAKVERQTISMYREDPHHI